MSSHSKAVYDKASGILAAIEKCSCSHCLEILKRGLEQPLSNPTDADEHPKVQLRNVQRYSS